MSNFSVEESSTSPSHDGAKHSSQDDATKKAAAKDNVTRCKPAGNAINSPAPIELNGHVIEPMTSDVTEGHATDQVPIIEVALNDEGKGTSSSTKFKVVQIGCGVVGHAYAMAFKQAGHDVIGVEASYSRIEELQTHYTLKHVNDDMSNVLGVDFILLSINTPLDPGTGALNMRYLWSSLENVTALLSASPQALVVVRSTVTLGFSAAYKASLTERLGRAASVCFQPEFLRAKSALEDALSPWQVVIGCNSPKEVRKYVIFQQKFIDARRISLCTVDEAEIMKIFHNSFNAAKISFFNQAGLLVDKICVEEGKNIDPIRTFHLIGKTCEGLLNPAYGLTSGHAYYGTCLPKDSAELANMEKTYGMESNLFSQVVKVNDIMRAQDKQEVTFGDNHADNALFFQRSAPNDTPCIIDASNAAISKTASIDPIGHPIDISGKIALPEGITKPAEGEDGAQHVLLGRAEDRLKSVA